MKPYELAFIIKPNIDEEGVTAIVDKVSGYIGRGQGEVAAMNIWGRRRLAYPIKNHREGTYVLCEANLPPLAVQEIEREFRLSEDILRFLVFKKDS